MQISPLANKIFTGSLEHVRTGFGFNNRVKNQTNEQTPNATNLQTKEQKALGANIKVPINKAQDATYTVNRFNFLNQEFETKKLNTGKDMREEFKNTYIMTDEFAKTAEFERLFVEYFPKKISFETANEHKFTEDDFLKKEILSRGYNAKDWLDFFDQEIKDAKNAIKNGNYTKQGIEFLQETIEFFSSLQAKFAQIKQLDLKV